MYQNFFATRLYTDAGSSDTTLTLETPPTVTSGRLVLEARNATNREIIGYTGVSGNQVTGVTRGIGGTTAKPHIKGSKAEMNVTAEDLTDALAVPNTLATQFKEALADFIVDNTGVVAQTVLLTGSFSDIGFYIDGVRYSQTSIPNNVYIVSRDTYVDINNAGVVTYSDVALGAAAPALAANSIRVAKVTTNGSAITSVVLTSRGSVTGVKIDYSTFTNAIVSSSNIGSRSQGLTPSGGVGVAYSTNNPTLELKPGTYLLIATASCKLSLAAQDSSFHAAIYNNTASADVAINGTGSTGVSATVYPSYSVMAVVTIAVNTTYSGRLRQTYGAAASYTFVSTNLIVIPIITP